MTWTISGWKASTIKTPSLDWGSSKGPERKDLPHTSQLILNRRSESMQSLPACVSKSSMPSPAMLKVVRSPNFCVLVLKETKRAAILNLPEAALTNLDGRQCQATGTLGKFLANRVFGAAPGREKVRI